MNLHQTQARMNEFAQKMGTGVHRFPITVQVNYGKHEVKQNILNNDHLTS